MARDVFYDRKTGLNPRVTIDKKSQIPNAEEQLTQKSNKEMHNIALYALVAYFLFC